MAASSTLAGLIIRNWMPFVVIMVLVTAVSIWVGGSKQEKNYYGSMLLTAKVEREFPETSNLILQSDTANDTKVAIATTQSWLADPALVRGVLEQANVANREKLSLAGLAEIFEVIVPVEASSSYQVQYTGSSQEEVETVYTSLRAALDQMTEEYNQEGPAIGIRLIYGDVEVTDKGMVLPLTPIAGLLAGTLFALVVVALLERSRG